MFLFTAKWTANSVFTMRQTLIVENEGLLPVDVYSTSIGGSLCQSYGFKVLGCRGFSLRPNETRGLEVVFTPDFSLFQMEQWLVMATSNATVSVRLAVNIAALAGAKCSFKIPRPTWEPLLYYSLIIVSTAMIIGVVTWAALEAKFILGSSFVPMTTVLPVNVPLPSFDKNKVFDLRSIGATPSGHQESPLNNENLIRCDTSSSTSSPEMNKHNNNNLEPFMKINNSIMNNAFSANTSSSLNNKRSGTIIANSNTSMKAKLRCDGANKTNLNARKKNNFGLSSFLSSLPFTLNNETKVSNNNNTPRGKKAKEIPNKSYKFTSEEEISSTTTESSSTDDICVFIKVRITFFLLSYW